MRQPCGSNGETNPDRFQYIPLPTITSKLGRVESIRRVLVAAPAQCEEQIAWARRHLAGELLEHDGPRALLTILPGSDWVLRQYVAHASEWSTVTPVILSGHDHCKAAKAVKLLRTAFIQAFRVRENFSIKPRSSGAASASC